MSAIVREPSQTSWSGLEAIQDVQEWSRRPPRCIEVVGRPSRISRSVQEALPYVR